MPFVSRFAIEAMEEAFYGGGYSEDWGGDIRPSTHEHAVTLLDLAQNEREKDGERVVDFSDEIYDHYYVILHRMIEHGTRHEMPVLQRQRGELISEGARIFGIKISSDKYETWFACPNCGERAEKLNSPNYAHNMKYFTKYSGMSLFLYVEGAYCTDLECGWRDGHARVEAGGFRG